MKIMRKNRDSEFTYMYDCSIGYILNEVETNRHLISIRLYFMLTILITEDDHNHISFLTIATQLFVVHNL
jgi:hypothetical protein